MKPNEIPTKVIAQQIIAVEIISLINIFHNN